MIPTAVAMLVKNVAVVVLALLKSLTVIVIFLISSMVGVDLVIIILALMRVRLRYDGCCIVWRSSWWMWVREFVVAFDWRDSLESDFGSDVVEWVGRVWMLWWSRV